MLAVTSSSSRLVILASPWPNLSRPLVSPLLFASDSRRRVREREFVFLRIVKRGSLLGFSQDLFGGRLEFSRMCTGFDCEGDLVLEAEILEFMKFSRNPESFPSKKELVDAGRMDLVDSIKTRGGWLTLGWDLDEEEKEMTLDTSVRNWECGMDVSVSDSFPSAGDGSQYSVVIDSSLDDTSQLASSSGRSLETITEDESGINGILSRLGKRRNFTFGFGLKEKAILNGFISTGDKDNWHSKRSENVTATELQVSNILASSRHKKGILDDLSKDPGHNRYLLEVEGIRDPRVPESPRTRVLWQAWIRDVTSKAIETEISIVKRGVKSGNSAGKDISRNQLQSRLQHLEAELSTVLHSLKSNTDDCAISKVEESYPDDLEKLSDAWEFQETEIMNAKDKLRSIRAKLAVVEGKMAMALIDAQKMVEAKQKRIEDEGRTLQMLRATCIVWPNSATEVLLAGSFDGWSSQRKMEKSRTGVFSLCLKLYPGRYEIKFIVDGQWRIDPLRPIVHNNGYENNELLIT